ncbi:MAG: hypothetical protein ACOH2N_06985 [Devosia sp.]
MTQRERLEYIIETALCLLDQIDGDCDLEPEALESSLGGTCYSAGGKALDDLELDNSDHELEEPTRLAPNGSWIYGGANAA